MGEARRPEEGRPATQSDDVRSSSSISRPSPTWSSSTSSGPCSSFRSSLIDATIDTVEHEGDHREREERGDVVPLGDDHLDADEGEDDRQARLQVVELVAQVGEQEVERSQAEDGEGVRAEDDELLAAHGEDGRDRVDREDDVGRLDQDEHGEERRRQALAVLLGEQLLAVVLARRRHDPAHGLEHRVVLGMDLLVVVPQQADRREDQEAAEHEEHPLEPLDQRDAGEDEDDAEHERPEDAPEEHPELVLPWHGEVAHDDRPHEHVVDREALLDQVAGDVLTGGLTAPRRPDDDR